MKSEAVLSLRGVGRVFGSGGSAVAALKSVDLEVRAGESVAITGRSGSGKSTLLNVLGLLDNPTQGSYRVHGSETTALTSRELSALRARIFGFVFQSFHLVPYLTVAETVEMGLTYFRTPGHERRSRVERLLEEVGLTHRRDARVATLSGGEKQRAAVARALIRQPRVLLADEPTGNLDEASAADVLALFDEVVAGGVALVMVTHDPATADRADSRHHMRDGVLSG